MPYVPPPDVSDFVLMFGKRLLEFCFMKTSSDRVLNCLVVFKEV